MFNAVKSFFGQSGLEHLLPLHNRDVQKNSVIQTEQASPAALTIPGRHYSKAAKQLPRWIAGASPAHNENVAQQYLAEIREQADPQGEDKDIAVISTLLGNEAEEGKLNKSENKEAAVVYWNALASAMLELTGEKRVTKDMEAIRKDLSPHVRAWLQYQPALPPVSSDAE